MDNSLVKFTLFLWTLPWLAAFAQTPVPAPPALNATSYILVDFSSGKELVSQDADATVEPASITKLMTAYVVFHELAAGNLKLTDMVTVSENAWRTGGSRMFIEVNTQVSIEDLLKGMIIQSGNDASVALAEHIAGSEATFAGLMNHYAQQLGMKSSHFENATGLPGENHIVSARDIALLAAAIIREFPELYEWYSEKEFTYNEIRQHNRNTLLWHDPAVDGIKTGHTDSAGYCLASSAIKGGMRLISVVMGADSEKQRADDSQKLLNYGFRFFETHQLYTANEQLDTVKVWKGETDQLPLGLAESLFVTIPRGQYAQLDAAIRLPGTLTAPIIQNAVIGEVRVTLDGDDIATRPLIALAGIPEGGFWSRLSDSISLWFESDDEG